MTHSFNTVKIKKTLARPNIFKAHGGINIFLESDLILRVQYEVGGCLYLNLPSDNAAKASL
jgi:hypothetical protein